MNFSNKTVLITGASSGIGHALALEFARRGARVAVLARRAERLNDLVTQAKAAGGEALALTADVTKEADLIAAVKQVREKWGALDIVVANAGFGVAGNFEKLTNQDYERQFQTNVYGVFHTLRATLPDLKASRGVFAVMGSVMGFVTLPGQSAYGMSKFAVRAFCDSLRGELREAGVAVTHIAPGFVTTEIRQVDNMGRHQGAMADPIPEWLRMPADRAARQMVRAIGRRQREVVITTFGKAVVKIVAWFPGLVAWVMSKAKIKGRPEPKRVPA